MRLIYLLITFLFICDSCKTFTALKKMSSEAATFERWKNASNRTVIFLPMAHAGRPEFYQNVQKKIADFKNDGYIIFYEGVKSGVISDSNLSQTALEKYQRYPELKRFSLDSLKQFIYAIKLKRMVGIYPDSTAYSEFTKSLPILKKSVVQPSASNLGISDNDFNIDVTSIELVDRYEQANGAINLEQIDFAIPLSEPLPGFRRLKKKNVTPILINYRNEHLANAVQNSNYDKILVIYGLMHKKGTFEVLNRFDPSWEVLK